MYKTDISTVRHLTATVKLNFYLPQHRGYHNLDVVYSSNRQQEKCLQSANTFSVINKFPKHCIAFQHLNSQLMLR